MQAHISLKKLVHLSTTLNYASQLVPQENEIKDRLDSEISVVDGIISKSFTDDEVEEAEKNQD